jgi:DNA-binding phage protein
MSAPVGHAGEASLGVEKLRAVHAAYVRGDGSIEWLAEAIGTTGTVVRRQWQKLNLSIEAQESIGSSARSRAHAEQRVITALLMAKVDELRRSRGMALEALAHAAGLSTWTLQQSRRELSDPRLTTILRLCRGLGVTAGELLDELPLPVEARPRRGARSRDRDIRRQA